MAAPATFLSQFSDTMAQRRRDRNRDRPRHKSAGDAQDVYAITTLFIEIACRALPQLFGGGAAK